MPNRTKLAIVVLISTAIVGLFVFGGVLSFTGSLPMYTVLLLCLITCCGVFLAIGHANFSIRSTHLSSVLSVLFVLEFGIVPLISVYLGQEAADADLNLSLFIILLGSIAFWGGCLVRMRRCKDRIFIPFQPQLNTAPISREQTLALGLFFVSVVAQIYMIRSGMYSYIADPENFSSSLNYIQYISVLANFSYTSLALLGIEYFSSPMPSRSLKASFWGVYFANIAIGIVSGMKSEALTGSLIVLVIWQAISGKSIRRWGLVLVVSLVVLYPINTAYRGLVQENGTGVRSLGNSVNLLSTAVNERDPFSLETLQLGFQRAFDRINLLAPLHFLVTCPETEIEYIIGDSRLYMLPYFALIPRALWSDKPIVNHGQRLNEVVTGSSGSSMAVTIFGDLYIEGGYSGLIIGMFILGMLIQTADNLVIGRFDAKQLFLFVTLFRISWMPEWDALSFWGGWVRDIPIALVIGFIVFGGKFLSPRSTMHDEQRVFQTRFASGAEA